MTGAILVGCPEEGVELATCTSDDNCDDQVFCNGVEVCEPDHVLASARGCVPGRACFGACDEAAQICETSPCFHDGDCNDGRFCNGVEVCERVGSKIFGRCQNAIGGEACPGDDQVCDEDEESCLGPCELRPDHDGDGSVNPDCGGTDCDDEDPHRAPNRVERCYADDPIHDEDCDSRTFAHPAGDDDSDDDGDGFIDDICCNEDEPGVLYCGNDCNDEDPNVHPLQVEVCNGIDDNCNGEIDEGLLVTLYADADGDGAGDPDVTAEVCLGSEPYAEYGNDCDDENPSIHPYQIEICNGVDDNCNDEVDEGLLVTLYADGDGDGFGDPDVMAELCPSAEPYSERAGDCDDTNPHIIPGSIVCVSGGQGYEYEMCVDGEWTDGFCLNGLQCIAQPPGFGICVTRY